MLPRRAGRAAHSDMQPTPPASAGTGRSAAAPAARQPGCPPLLPRRAGRAPDSGMQSASPEPRLAHRRRGREGARSAVAAIQRAPIPARRLQAADGHGSAHPAEPPRPARPSRRRPSPGPGAVLPGREVARASQARGHQHLGASPPRNSPRAGRHQRHERRRRRRGRAVGRDDRSIGAIPPARRVLGVAAGAGGGALGVAGVLVIVVVVAVAGVAVHGAGSGAPLYGRLPSRLVCLGEMLGVARHGMQAADTSDCARECRDTGSMPDWPQAWCLLLVPSGKP
mmetsp:Transcript_102872/g.320547  ORF Transcript_102872/g.320547 Transcript_102872/m.320547 type:complete len:282 (+) Transcript_102872:170-1015(+)